MEQPHTNLLHSIPFSENNGVMYWLFGIERSLQSTRAKPLSSRAIVEALLHVLSSALNQQVRPISLTNRWVNRCIPRHEERAFFNNEFLAAPFEFNFAK